MHSLPVLMQLSQGLVPFVFSHFILDLRHLVQAMLERMGGRIFCGFLLSTSSTTPGLIAVAQLPGVLPPPTPSNRRSSVSDVSVSEYARGVGEAGLEKGSDGQNDCLGFGDW